MNLSSCFKLQALPEGLSCCASLQKLNLSCCDALTEIPDRLGQELRGLKDLNLSGCSALETIPDSFWALSGLQILGLSNLVIDMLSEEFTRLASLRSLDLSGSSRIIDLPEGIGALSLLQNLDLHGCFGLSEIPESVGELVSLRYLNISGCSGLQTYVPSQDLV